VGHSKTREHQNSSTWFLPASTPRHHMDPPKRAPYRSKRSIAKTWKKYKIIFVLGEQNLLRSRKFLWSQPRSTSVTLIETLNENRSEPPTIYAPKDTKGVVTTRVAVEDRLPNRGCAGGVTILVTRGHSYRFFLQHEEFEFLFLVDVLWSAPCLALRS
jgi:hypothetical protein